MDLISMSIGQQKKSIKFKMVKKKCLVKKSCKKNQFNNTTLLSSQQFNILKSIYVLTASIHIILSSTTNIANLKLQHIIYKFSIGFFPLSEKVESCECFSTPLM